MVWHPTLSFFFFFFNDTATTEIYTLSLHDALPILNRTCTATGCVPPSGCTCRTCNARNSFAWVGRDRKSTRLNSSHLVISYAVFCLKKKNIISLHPRLGYSCEPLPGTSPRTTCHSS